MEFVCCLGLFVAQNELRANKTRDCAKLFCVCVCSLARACVLRSRVQKTSVCRFRLCRFLSPLFYLFSFFKSVYLTCFGFFVFYSLSLSLSLLLAVDILLLVQIDVCVPFFTPKKAYIFSRSMCVCVFFFIR